MNPTTPMNTATAGGAVAVLTPLVAWASTHWHLDMPADVHGSVAVILVFCAHWLGDFLSAVLAARAAKAASSPSTQGATQ